MTESNSPKLTSADVKRCTKCKKVKFLTDFYKESRCKRDGATGRCKQCEAEYRKEYAKRRPNIEKYRRRSKEWKERNKEQQEAYRKEYYRKRSEDPEWRKKNTEKSRRYALANLEKTRKYKRDWARNNKEKRQKQLNLRYIQDKIGREQLHDWYIEQRLCSKLKIKVSTLRRLPHIDLLIEAKRQYLLARRNIRDRK